MAKKKRDYDLVVLGATGFTGKLVAEYLLAQYGLNAELRWAVAGRNEAKLESLRSELGAPELPILLADSDDVASLDTLAQQTAVICSTVGPYALYGSNTVAACARHGTDYCDLTGEVQWMQRMIADHQHTAQDSGARLVHTCGFDSIPSDLGVLFVQNAMLERHGVTAPRVKYRVKGFSGAFSGGTVASMINMFEEMSRDPSLKRQVEDPYALLPPDAARGNDVTDQSAAVYDEDFECWTIPFVMAAINTRVVRRSNALLEFPWGEDFRYNEAILTKDGSPGWQAKVAAAGNTAGSAAMGIAPLRAMMKRFLPSPGEGPTLEQREKGYFDIRMHASHPTDASKNVGATVEGDRDPGYGSTAKMLGESAVSLALDKLPRKGGFWTPASALGVTLIERLHTNAGVSFTLQD
jgi:short subunit dehydrogenase-like uncharacterized protein